MSIVIVFFRRINRVHFSSGIFLFIQIYLSYLYHIIILSYRICMVNIVIRRENEIKLKSRLRKRNRHVHQKIPFVALKVLVQYSTIYHRQHQPAVINNTLNINYIQKRILLNKNKVQNNSRRC